MTTSEFGLTREGIVIKTIQDTLLEIETEQKDLFGPGFSIAEDTPQGQLNGVFADRISELWELLQAKLRSRQPSFAEGAALDEILALSGAERLEAKPSTVELCLVRLGPDPVVPVGTIFATSGDGTQWISTATADTSTGELVPVESVELGPVFASASAIDSLVTPVADLEERPFVRSLTSGPFALFDYATLEVTIDNSQTQTIEFRAADFTDITAATLPEVLAAISTQFSNVESEVLAPGFLLWSSTQGSGSSIEILGGTAAARLGLSTQRKTGFNRSTRGLLSSGNVEPFDLTMGTELFIRASESNPFQTVMLSTSDGGELATGTIQAIPAEDHDVSVDSFTINDGAQTRSFFFGTPGAMSMATSSLITITGSETAVQMAQLIRTSIDESPLNLDVSEASDPSIVLLRSRIGGVGSNNAITSTVVDPGFVVSGLAGGTNVALTNVPAHRVAEVINAQASGVHAYDSGGNVIIETETDGVNGLVEVLGGAFNASLAFPISSPQSGVTGDVMLGRNVETDAQARMRRPSTLNAPGGGSVPAIRAAVSNLPGVTFARVFENPLQIIDASGRPPCSVEVVVAGGDDQQIAETIHDKKAGGVQAWGVPGSNGVQTVVTDSNNNDFNIGFSRPDQIRLFIEIDLTAQEGVFGAGIQSAGVQEVRLAVKDLVDALSIGDDVNALRLRCAPLPVAGVLDVSTLRVDTIDPPINTGNLVIGDRSLVTVLLSDITVNVAV